MIHNKVILGMIQFIIIRHHRGKTKTSYMRRKQSSRRKLVRCSRRKLVRCSVGCSVRCSLVCLTAGVGNLVNLLVSSKNWSAALCSLFRNVSSIT